ncbi:MAG: PAS domain S-box protein [Ignavibacteriaceae bacterium]|nr:PAS domain S-box protein [Ignavibacteriaceae bacterium]
MNRWLWFLTAVILIIALVLSGNIYLDSENQIIKEFDDHQMFIAKDLNMDLYSEITSIVKSSNYLSLESENNNFKEIFKRKTALNGIYPPYVEAISVYNQDGRLIGSNSVRTDQLKKEIIKNILNGNYNFFIDDDERLIENNKSISNFIVYIPLKELNLIMAFQINAPEFFKANINNMNLKADKFGIWVIDQEGNVLFQSDHPSMESRNVNRLTNNCFNCHTGNSYLKEIQSNSTGHLKYSLKNSGTKKASFSTLDLNNEHWKIVVTTPSEEVTVYLVKAAKQALILLLLVILLLSIITYFAIKFFKIHFRAREELNHMTEKNKLLSQVIESETKYKDLFENNPIPMWVYSVDSLKFEIVNDAAVRHYGFTREEFLSMTLKDIGPDDEISKLENNLTQSESKIETFNSWHHRKKDGTIINVEITSHSLPSTYGNHFRLVMAKDVTEKFHLQKELEESEEKFRNIFENTKAIFIIIDPSDGKIVEANDAACEFYGYSQNEMFEEIYLSQINTLPEDKIKIEMQKAAQNSIRFFSFKHRLKNGSVKDVEVFSGPIHFLGRNLLFSVIHDITEKKLAEEDIKLLAYALESINECISITDLNNKITYVNGAFCKVYGYFSHEIIGRHIAIVMARDNAEEVEKNILASTINGEWKGELINKRKNGEEFPVYLSTSPIRNENGEIISLLGVALDMTDVIVSREELIRAKDKAEEMNRLKSNFLANMSHELRTPMIGMLGFSQILKQELDNPEQQEMAEAIYSSGQRLMQTLNLVLDLSRIEANKMEIKLNEINIKEIINSSAKIYEAAAKNKNLYLNKLFKNDNIYCFLDELLMVQIINNLLSNALKFTKIGGITIELDTENYGADTWALIKVIDTGIGIPEDYQPLIFEEFRQVSEGLGRSYEGSGLGLTLTKKTVEIMNGSITVSSELGKGSVFTLRFPAVIHDNITPDNLDDSNKVQEIPFILQNPDLPNLLLVENDRASAFITKRALKEICTVDLANDGETAVELARKKAYSAIIMDIGLGYGMNGMEAAKIIRKFPGYEKIPIIALTAFAMDGDKENFLAQGMTHYLSKPFDLKDLKILIIDILNDLNNKSVVI